ncbi:ABC transporter permease [Lutibaculum baratangense]|uniref:Spermidine Putrescine ABC transporter permease component PotB n=1 Tax=Lutibaculum baratangense AMV1 TaxID=631454 RepID=V4R501_9HYPH|nr:ABC transporter permease [Lutibaculum baratangense]ESR27027.1 Spermidine Putrescine ABC transporter permease component PotB [Lutibaculum baratangense AMV1]
MVETSQEGPRAARSLKRSLARAERRRKLRAFLLVLPLILFVLAFFAAPIIGMLERAVVDRDLMQAWPRTAEAVKAHDWSEAEVPGEEVFAVLGPELASSFEARTAAGVARRLNYDLDGGRSLVMNTARSVARLDETPPAWRDAILEIEPRWGEPATWTAIRRAAGPVTDFYLLQTIDRQRVADGSIASVPRERAIYLQIYGRTFAIALSVTLLCLAIGFPIAYLLASLPANRANLLLILVLLPFWTPLLVRTAAWVVVLQEQGLVNQMLQFLQVTDRPIRLVYNRTGVIISMTHVLLPFMILPLYAVMQTVPPHYMRAARSLGAPPFTAFRRVYIPQVMPGIAAGSILVFIIALGYYITPALVGGASDQMVSYYIAFYTTDTVNWGLAGALGAGLLAATLLLYTVYSRLVGGVRGVM